METTDPTNYWDEPWLTAFELGKWFNVDTDSVLGLVEDGWLPQPRVFRPLRWHQDDLAGVYIPSYSPPAYYGGELKENEHD